MNAQRTATYDTIGERFESFTGSATQRPIEIRTFMGMIGDVAGLRVLDLACGYGYFSRRIREAGAAVVTGIDISAEMIRLAREESARSGDGIDFYVANARELPDLGEFDLVTAAWLFNYAEDVAELREMFASAGARLRPGGRLVAYTVNPAFVLAGGNFTPYGVHVIDEVPVPEGYRHRGQFMTEPRSDFTFHRWSADAYREAALAAGFTRPQWRHPSPDDSDRAGHPAGYWNVFENNCLQAGFSCTR